MFCAVSYNIFARSLGSTCIPWVMQVSEEWKAVIEERMEMRFSVWVKSMLTNEYKTHFHKNYYTGNKNVMRALWSKHICTAADVPTDMTDLVFVSEDRLGYIVDGSLVVATTLHGLLVTSLPDLAEDLYSHIVKDEHHFVWENRGPKIFDCTVGNVPGIGRPPDIVVLTEYDIHAGTADYRRNGTQERFPEAMRYEGYVGGLMQAPLDMELSGLGIFWKSSAFEIDSCDSADQSLDSGIEGADNIFELKTGSVYRGARNFDLHERSHKLVRTENGTMKGRCEEFSIEDRKNVFFVRLRHKETNKIVLVIGLHLMTDSRDCPETNEFPGEVRAHELETIGNILVENQVICDGVDAILMMGDFNIDVSEINILKGELRSCVDGSCLSVCTRISDTNECNSPVLDFNATTTAVSPSRSHFRLVEAFADIHKWRVVKQSDVCSSYNTKRRSWIDMIWYSETTLEVTEKGEMEVLSSPIPNEVHGSDHLPLYAMFTFLN